MGSNCILLITNSKRSVWTSNQGLFESLEFINLLHFCFAKLEVYFQLIGWQAKTGRWNPLNTIDAENACEGAYIDNCPIVLGLVWQVQQLVQICIPGITSFLFSALLSCWSKTDLTLINRFLVLSDFLFIDCPHRHDGGLEYWLNRLNALSSFFWGRNVKLHFHGAFLWGVDRSNAGLTLSGAELAPHGQAAKHTRVSLDRFIPFIRGGPL